MTDLAQIREATDAARRWLDSLPSHLPAPQLTVSSEGDIEVSWHEADAKTARAIVAVMVRKWTVRVASRSFWLQTTVEIDANTKQWDCRAVELTIFVADDVDVNDVLQVQR